MKNGEKGPVIYGYAAHLGKLSEDLGGFQEQLDENSFDEVLKTSDCRAFINHNADLLMGRQSSGSLKLKTNTKGLQYEFAAYRFVDQSALRPGDRSWGHERVIVLLHGSFGRRRRVGYTESFPSGR